MPDLDRPGVLAWLKQHEPDIEQRAGLPLRQIEDAEGIPELFARLGQSLDRARNNAGGALGGAVLHDDGQEVREVLAQLGPARLLRLSAWFDAADPGDERLRNALLRDETGAAGRTIRATLSALNRHALLARIFAPERLEALGIACDAAAREAA